MSRRQRAGRVWEEPVPRAKSWALFAPPAVRSADRKVVRLASADEMKRNTAQTCQAGFLRNVLSLRSTAQRM
jgi:hypothetical protein